MVLGWDHMEKNWLTEMVTDSEGSFFTIGVGPMFDIGPVSFNAPLSFSLTKTGLSDELDLAPRFDINAGKFLIQNWYDIIFTTEYFDSWTTDNRVLYKTGVHKVGINVLTSSEDDFHIATVGALDQYKITSVFTICTFLGVSSDNETVAWLKAKFFLP